MKHASEPLSYSADGESDSPIKQAYALPRMTVKQEQRAYQNMRSSSLSQLALLTADSHSLELLKDIVELTEEEAKRYSQTIDTERTAAALDLLGLIDALETVYYLQESQDFRQRQQRLKRRLAEWSAPHHMIVSAVSQSLRSGQGRTLSRSSVHYKVFDALKASQQQYRAQRNKLTNANLRLVYSVAFRFRFLGLPHEDLVQEGSLGLMKAIERYEPAKGFLFSTYAYRVISQSIHNALDKQTHLVRKPFRQLREKALVDKARMTLEQQLARPLRGHELEKCLPASLEYTQAHIVANVAPSADTQDLYTSSVNPEDHQALESNAQDFATHLLTHKAILEHALQRLDKRTQTILRMRYGFGTSKSYTLKEISETLSLSGERVRQISQKAIAKLQHDLDPSAANEPQG